EEGKLDGEEDPGGRHREPGQDGEELPHAMRARSSASNASVAGRLPRHSAKDSAACSTSVPRPSDARMPAAFARSTNARAPAPYARSYANAPRGRAWSGSTSSSPRVDVDVALSTTS